MEVEFWARYVRVEAEPGLMVWRVAALPGGPRRGRARPVALTNGRMVGTGARLRGEACDHADLRYEPTHAWEALAVASGGEHLLVPKGSAAEVPPL